MNFHYKYFLLTLCALFYAAPLTAASENADNLRQVKFSQFSVELPQGWDGEEQSGFVSNNPEEYALTLGQMDEAKENFVAQITIYLLPNKPGVNSEKAAQTLAESQSDVTPPIKKGEFWQFRGEPRSRTIKGMATTMVRADPKDMLIIISQGLDEKGAAEIIESLRGETERSQRMLGR